MPELPEVEVLARHLRPLLDGQIVKGVEVRRARIIKPTSESELAKKLRGARFEGLFRRGKYLVFEMCGAGAFQLLGHLGMTGRFFLARKTEQLPKHAAVVLDLGRDKLVFEDTRYFGRFTLDMAPLAALGPEPLGDEFTAEHFTSALKRSSQAIKVKLLDQSVVAGVGNIYASEALYHAGISPKLKAHKLNREQVVRLRDAICQTLERAIGLGSSLALDFAGNGERDGLFYYGGSPDAPASAEERFFVYDRAGKPCVKCRTPIKRMVQAARSTYFCPQCQKGR